MCVCEMAELAPAGSGRGEALGRKEKGSAQQRTVVVKIQLGTGVATVIAGAQRRPKSM